MESEPAMGADVHVLACAECPRVSSVSARGWKAFRTDDPEANELPQALVLLSGVRPARVQRQLTPQDPRCSASG